MSLTGEPCACSGVQLPNSRLGTAGVACNTGTKSYQLVHVEQWLCMFEWGQYAEAFTEDTHVLTCVVGPGLH